LSPPQPGGALLPRIASPMDAGLVPGAKTANIRDIRALRLAIAAAAKGKKHRPGRNFPVRVGESNR